MVGWGVGGWGRGVCVSEMCRLTPDAYGKATAAALAGAHCQWSRFLRASLGVFKPVSK